MAHKDSKGLVVQRTLNIWAIVLFVWAIYRSKFHLPIWFDEFIAKPLVFIYPVYYYITQVEKSNFFEGINLKFRRLGHNIIVGSLVGIAIFMTSYLAYFYKTGRVMTMHNLPISSAQLLLYTIIAVATAFSEEVLSRGFVLKRLYKEWGNIYTASLVASLLFFVLHIPSLFTTSKVTGPILLLLMINTLSLGFVNSILFITEDSLLVPILIHVFYSISIFIFF